MTADEMKTKEDRIMELVAIGMSWEEAIIRTDYEMRRKELEDKLAALRRSHPGGVL